MDNIKAGNFELEVSDPWPCWIKIKYNGEKIASIHHMDLSDLEYAVKKAMQSARLKLKDNADEV